MRPSSSCRVWRGGGAGGHAGAARSGVCASSLGAKQTVGAGRRGPTSRAGGVRGSGVRRGRTSRLPRAGPELHAQACHLDRVDLDQRVHVVAGRNVGGRTGGWMGGPVRLGRSGPFGTGGSRSGRGKPAGLGAGRWSSQPLTGLWHTWRDRPLRNINRGQVTRPIATAVSSEPIIARKKKRPSRTP